MALDAGETPRPFSGTIRSISPRASPRRSGWSPRRPAPTPAKAAAARGQRFAEERFDREIMTEMGALGFLGPTLPEDYGGAGVNHVAYGLIAREIEAIDSGYRSAMSVQSSLVMYPIYAFGSEEQRRRWLPAMASGEIDRLLRPDRGRRRLRPGLDAHRRQAGRRRLSCSTAPRCGSPTRRSPTSRWCGPSSTAIIRGFLVERGAEGLRDAEDQEQAVPARLGHRRDLALRRVRARGRACCPDVQGLRGPFSCLNKARYGIAWGAMGAAEFCLHAARDYVASRKVFGKPLAARQLVQKKLADMTTEIALGYEGALALGRLIDAGRLGPRGHQPDEAQQLRQGAGHRPRRPATCTAATASAASTT